MAGVLTLGVALVPAVTFAAAPAAGEPPLISGQFGDVPFEVPNPGLPLQPPPAGVTSEVLDATAQVGAAPATGTDVPGEAAPGSAERGRSAPDAAAPDAAEPDAAEPTNAEPANAEPANAEPAKAKSVNVKAGRPATNRIEGATSSAVQRTAVAATRALDQITVASTLQDTAQLVRGVTAAITAPEQDADPTLIPREDAERATRTRVDGEVDAFYTSSAEPIPPLATDVVRAGAAGINAQPTSAARPLTGLGLALIPVALVGAAFAFRLRPAGGRHAA